MEAKKIEKKLPHSNEKYGIVVHLKVAIQSRWIHFFGFFFFCDNWIWLRLIWEDQLFTHCIAATSCLIPSPFARSLVFQHRVRVRKMVILWECGDMFFLTITSMSPERNWTLKDVRFRTVPMLYRQPTEDSLPLLSWNVGIPFSVH